MITTGTVFYTLQEGWSVIDALYFSVITLTTVGLGDLAPTSDVAKLFTVGYVLFGIGVLIAFVDKVARRRVEHRMNH